MIQETDAVQEKDFDVEYLPTPLEQQRRFILDNFDFDKVHRCMVALNWGWSDGLKDMSTSIPDSLRIYKGAEGSLYDVIELSAANPNENCSVYSGGFEARLVDGWLSMAFVVDKVSGDDDDIPATCVPQG